MRFRVNAIWHCMCLWLQHTFQKNDTKTTRVEVTSGTMYRDGAILIICIVVFDMGTRHIRLCKPVAGYKMNDTPYIERGWCYFEMLTYIFTCSASQFAWMPSCSDATWRWQLGCCFATSVEIHLPWGHVWLNNLRLTDAGLYKILKFVPAITHNQNVISRSVTRFVI